MAAREERLLTVDRLFTYGSLQPGGPSEHVLEGIHGEWQPGDVTGFLVEAGWGAALGYPALRLDPAGDPVPGFVFTSSELANHWDRLDRFEGSEYLRVVADVRLDDGQLVPACVYVLE